MNSFGLVFVLLIASLTHAADGGWHSSGGGSFGLEKNPWFLKNTKSVNYCIQVDEGSFSASKADIKEAIKFAFDYWKSELDMGPASRGFTPIATQDFIEVSACEDSTPIVFKMGYGTLIPKEIEFLKDTHSYIGVTILKEYDTKNLTGSGVVYISSDFGPSAYRNEGNLLEKAWSKSKLLKYALIHEVGHIMGISHIGVGIMSEMFLTNLLNSTGWMYYASRPFITLTRPMEMAEVCNPDMSGNFEPSFFGLTVDDFCLKIEKLNTDMTSNVWTVSSKRTKKDEFSPIGRLQITDSGSIQMLSQKPLIYVYLPTGQTAIPKSEMGLAEFLIGGVTQSGNYQAIFTKTGSHKPYHVQINTTPESLVVSGIVADRITPVFSFSIPALKGIIFP